MSNEATLDDQYGEADPMKPSTLANGRVRKITALADGATSSDRRTALDVAHKTASAELAAIDEQLSDDALTRYERNPLEHAREVLRLTVEGLEAALGEINAEPAAAPSRPARVTHVEIPDDPPAAKPTRRRG